MPINNNSMGAATVTLCVVSPKDVKQARSDLALEMPKNQINYMLLINACHCPFFLRSRILRRLRTILILSNRLA